MPIISGIKLSDKTDGNISILKVKLKSRGLIDSADKREVISYLLDHATSDNTFSDEVLDKLAAKKKNVAEEPDSFNLLELFAGTRSIGKEADKLGFDVFSTDIEKYRKINLVCDILEIDLNLIPFIPDAIWGSPDCKGFSVASLHRNWGGGLNAYLPITDNAHNSIALSRKAIEVVQHYLKLNPNLTYFLENPRGVMRHMDYVKEFLEVTGGQRHTIWYCKYGDNRAKPTDIFTNSKIWQPRTVCKNYRYDAKGKIIDKHCHHDSARRGSKEGGTQGQKNNRERSVIPAPLCREIMKSLCV